MPNPLDRFHEEFCVDTCKKSNKKCANGSDCERNCISAATLYEIREKWKERAKK